MIGLMVFVDNRSEEILIPLIEKCIKQKYIQTVGNHIKILKDVDPITHVHANSIECFLEKHLKKVKEYDGCS